MRNLYQDDNFDGEGVIKHFSHVVTSAEASANSADITITGVDAISEVQGVTVRASGGTFNTAGLDVSFATNVVTVAATSLAEGDVISGVAVYRNAS